MQLVILVCVFVVVSGTPIQRYQHTAQAKHSADGLKNVLFIVVDDLRPNIGAYHDRVASTPHLDQLAKEGLLFNRAYVQYAFCSPSRNSFMSGRRPDATRVWNNLNHFREHHIGRHWTSLPQYFRENGYITLGAGKLYHHGDAGHTMPPNNDYARSWSKDWPYFNSRPRERKCRSDEGACPVCAVIEEESLPLEDEQIRDKCMEHLRIAKEQNQPFFVGCGFLKPHVPWVFPERFLARFPERVEDFPVGQNRVVPTGMPEIAWHKPQDVQGCFPDDNDDIPKNLSLNSEVGIRRAQWLRRFYYACVAYQDDNIGQVLNELEVLGLKNNTAVIVFGDHGWHLGEQAIWGKSTNFEASVRIPTIIRTPWLQESVGKVSNVLAEAVDFYPTLAELVGLPHPKSRGEDVHGMSLLPVFMDPDGTVNLKSAAFSQLSKESFENPFSVFAKVPRHKIKVMGYSVRVDGWRYTSWFRFNGPSLQPCESTVMHRELYKYCPNSLGSYLSSHVISSCEEEDLEHNLPGELLGDRENVVNHPRHAATVKRLHQLIVDYMPQRCVNECETKYNAKYGSHPLGRALINISSSAAHRSACSAAE